MEYDEKAFDILVGSPHDEVVKILKRHNIYQERGGGIRIDDIRQYMFTHKYTGEEFLVNFKIGGDRVLDSIIRN